MNYDELTRITNEYFMPRLPDLVFGLNPVWLRTATPSQLAAEGYERDPITGEVYKLRGGKAGAPQSSG